MPQKKRTPFRPSQNKLAQKVQASEDAKLERAAKSTKSPRDRDNFFSKTEGEPEKFNSAYEETKSSDKHIKPSEDHSFARKEKLQKILAQSGMGSRREMEAAIVDGRITVNGKLAEIGDRASLDDRILLDNRPIRKPKLGQLPRILIYHKPEAEIVSRDDPEGRSNVFEKLPRVKGGKWTAIGRLDYNTSGLLIFTTSGELANRLAHPRFEVEREYAVRVMGELTHEQGEQLCNGIELEDGSAKFEWLREEGGESANRWYRVMLKEGRNREVRRMFEAVGIMVSRLMRVRFGMINLPARLKRGGLLELDEKQVGNVFKWADIPLANAGSVMPKEQAKPSTPKERRPVPRNINAGKTSKKN